MMGGAQNCLIFQKLSWQCGICVCIANSLSETFLMNGGKVEWGKHKYEKLDFKLEEFENSAF